MYNIIIFLIFTVLYIVYFNQLPFIFMFYQKRKVVFFIFYVGVCNCAFAQGKESDFSKIRENFEKIVENWDTQYSKELSTVAGVGNYCNNKKYQTELEKTLISIHKYDSMLFFKLEEKYNESLDKKIEKILLEIKKVEKEYNSKNFIRTLKKECSNKREVDRDKKNNDIGEASGDEEEILLELELKKYMNHITKSIDHLKAHMHYLEY